MSEQCKSCYKASETLPVQVRDERGQPWRDSTVKRCANDECWNICEGAQADRLLWVKNVYHYKYFGDYELSPEQLSAVWEAYTIAAAKP